MDEIQVIDDPAAATVALRLTPAGRRLMERVLRRAQHPVRHLREPRRPRCAQPAFQVAEGGLAAASAPRRRDRLPPAPAELADQCIALAGGHRRLAQEARRRQEEALDTGQDLSEGGH